MFSVKWMDADPVLSLIVGPLGVSFFPFQILLTFSFHPQ